MHNLSALNNYSSEYLDFTDTGPFDFHVSYNTGVYSVQTIQEDQPFIFHAVGDIDRLSSVDETGSSVTVEFTLLDVATNFVSFDATPPDSVALADSGSGVWTITGITKLSHWDWVKQHTIIKPEADRNTTWTYQVDITPPPVLGFTSGSWGVTINYAEDGEEMSDPLEQEFDPGIAEGISGHPVVTDPYNTDYSYQVVISSSDSTIDLITSAGSGGTALWASNTYTISGTKAQVNSHLSTLTLTTNHQTDWTLTYTLTNIASGTITVKTQNWLETVLNSESTNLGVARSYESNTVNPIYSADPVQIDDGNITGTPEYTVKLILGSNIGVILQSDDTEFPPPEWDSVTRSWTLVGTEAECNTALSKISLAPNPGVYTSTTLTYQQWRGVTMQANAIVALTGSERTTPIPGAETYTFTSDVEFTPTFEQAYYLDYEVLVVAGGGGGGAIPWCGTASSLVYSYSQVLATYPYTSQYYKVSGGGGGGVANFSKANYHIFRDANIGEQYAITVGTGGSAGYTPYTTTGAIISTDGTNSSITRISDSYLLAKSFGGYGGKCVEFDGYGMSKTGRTYAQSGDSGYYTVALDGGGYYTTSRVGPSTINENLAVTMPKAPHPYTLSGGTGTNWTYASTHQFYRGVPFTGTTTDINGTTTEYGRGSGLRYYTEYFADAPGAGGMAGVYDTQPVNSTCSPGAAATDEGYTDGNDGIVIIKFKQPS